METARVLWRVDTPGGHFEVIDTLYGGRAARVLYSGNRQAAQSGIPLDGQPEMLFDYNQRLLELAANLQPDRVLVIGGGACTLPTALASTLPTASIDIIEPNAELLRIARKYFDFPSNERLRVFKTDGRAYLRASAERYDLIVLDVFDNATVPDDFRTVPAFHALYDHVRAKGVLAMNIISGYYGPRSQVLRHVSAAASQVFGVEQVEIFFASRGYSLWLPQNFIMTARRSGDSLQPFMRYGSLRLPDVSPPALED